LRTTRLKSKSGGLEEDKLFAGKYRLLGEIARGGMGVVYRALQVDLNQKVALKVMLAGGYATKSAKRRFLFEAEASARLKHPNIVPVFDMGSEGENLYFTMALVNGAELKDRHTDLERPQLLDVMIEVCAGVDYAHKKGIIHRDLKPGNVMMNEDNTPLIMDFGLAKQLGNAADDDDELEDTEGAMTRDGSVMGTPHFMSPEQAGGRSSEIDTRTDIYALGVMLFQLWTHTYPYSGSGSEIVAKILTEEPPSPRSVDPTVDMDLEAVILKAMDREIDQRYESAADLKKDLECIRDGLPVSARRATVVYRVKKWAKRNRAVLSVAAAFCLIATIGIGAFVQKQRVEARRQEEAIQDKLTAAEQGLEGVRRDGSVFKTELEAFLSSEEAVTERATKTPVFLARLQSDTGLLSRLESHERPVDAYAETHDRARTLQQGFGEHRSVLREQIERLEVLGQVHAELDRATQGLEQARTRRTGALEALSQVAAVETQSSSGLVAAVGSAQALLAASREDVPAAAGAGATFSAALSGLDASLNTVRQSLFTAIRLSSVGAPEARAARTHLNEGNDLRAEVDAAAARAAGTRLATRVLLAAESLNALLAEQEPTRLDELRGRRLQAANLARSLVQRGLEADHEVKGLSDALQTANFVHAQALLGLKAYKVFDVRLADPEAFRDEQRPALIAMREKVLQETLALRAKLEGGGLRINVLTGKLNVKGAGQTSGRTLLALKMRVALLKKLASHPYMDDELERVRQASLAKVAETVQLVELKYGREKLAGALEKANAAVEKVAPADRPAKLAKLIKAWARAEKALKRGYVKPLSDEERESHRIACVVGKAKLHHGVASTLAATDRAGARAALAEAQRLYESLPAEAVTEATRQSLAADTARLADN
jgi:predicted Ser/Thr protein kinase